jgi:hypothetical protein
MVRRVADRRRGRRANGERLVVRAKLECHGVGCGGGERKARAVGGANTRG